MVGRLIRKQSSRPDEGRAENAVNGGDAEIFAMSRLIIACRAEGQWGSREDDNAKIDLIFTMEHPWQPKERLMVLCQAKSGASYGVIAGDGSGFKLLGAAKTAARRSTHAICLVWIDRVASRIFWAFLHPDSRPGPQSYGSYHEVSPATRYDLARCIAGRWKGGAAGGRGVVLPEQRGDVARRRALALQSYRSVGTVHSPILGPIEFTRIGWRHMFRRSRASRNKNASIILIPRLRALLVENPSVVAITATVFSKSEGFTTRQCEYLLKYSEVSARSAKGELRPVTVHVRLVEEIRYPTAWHSITMLTQQVTRRVAIKSAYYK